MEDEEEREQGGDLRVEKREKKSPFVIKIPSYQEVFDTSQSQTAPPPSLFTPSPSFSQAFNFIKNSEFYTPPPRAPPSSSSASASQPSTNAAAASSSGELGNQSELASSSSAVALSSSSQIAHNRNAILVSHRQLNHALTTVRHVNKTDVVTLGSTFGTLSHIMDASMEDLARCPGIGERKVKRLYDTFHEPFQRVVPKHPSVPETSTQNNFEPRLASEVKEDEKEEDASKKRKKDPETTIKSALSAAFAKYSDKVGKKNDNTQPEKIEESSSAAEANTKNKSRSKEAGSLI